jgi:hypothetical protein
MENGVRSVLLKLCENDSCKCCLDKSFISSEKYLLSKKNGDIKPKDVFKSSNKKILV